MSRYNMHLNDKGQCFNCLIKPLTYKRDRYYFCYRCSRAFDLDTKAFKPNWAWEDEYLPTERAARSDKALDEQRAREIAMRTLDPAKASSEALTRDSIREGQGES